MKDADNTPPEGTRTPGPTSLSLLDGVKAGDAACRERLVALYLPLVYHRYLARIPEQERGDIAQQVFATVFRRINGFEKRFDGPAFRGWLYRIAFHKVGDYLRRVRRQGRSIDGAEVPDLQPRGEAEEADERGILVRRALEIVRAEFEPETYEAAWRVLVDGRRAGEVAEALGKTKNAVYIAKSRVLSRLRAVLEELGEWGPDGATPGPSGVSHDQP